MSERIRIIPNIVDYTIFDYT